MVAAPMLPIRLRTRPVGPDGKTAQPEESEFQVPAGKQQEFTQDFSVRKPVLWSLNNPGALSRRSRGG